MTKIVCSHGFGTRADARGIFTDIAASFPNYKFLMFDYNEITPNGDTIVAPLDKQAEKLQNIIDRQNEDVIILAHSQGCIIAGLVDSPKIIKTILLAPPVLMSMQHVIEKMEERLGSEINLDGISKLPRTDGTNSYISKEYLKSVDKYNPMELYQKLANSKPTIFVRCTKDTVLGLTNINEIKNATHIDIDTDHDFPGDSRQKLIDIISNIL